MKLVNTFSPNLSGSQLKIGIVMSRFNKEVCEGLLTACKAELQKLGVLPQDVYIATVPGALEIPLMLQQMAKNLPVDGLVALGAVIRGETYHFEIVANESCRGVSEVGLALNIPIANAILTTETDDQALTRMIEKGMEAAKAVIEMINLKNTIQHESKRS